MTFSKLGTDTDTGQLVYLPKTARLQGLYIIGMQRMGKSGLLENLIMQDIDQQIGVCVLDPHGELIDHVLARLDPKFEKDVIFLDIKNYQHPFGLNLFTCSDLTNPTEVQKTVDQIMHIFEKLLGVSQDTPLILQYLRSCTYTLIANPGYTMAEIHLLLTDKDCRQQLVAQVKKPQVRTFWRDYDAMPPAEQRIERSSILRRVDNFLQDLILPIVGQSTTIDFRRIMDERKILLVKLDRTLDAVTSLIGSIIVALLLNASTSRQTQRQFHLYADEFQNFATEDFAVLLEQAAKWAIGVTMAHQNRSQLELSNKQAEANLKTRTLNVGNLVVFRVPTDADELAGQFDTTPPPAKEEDIEIIDGTEPIETPVKDVVHHLLNGGTHPNPVINAFSTGTLRKIEQHSSGQTGDKNYLLRPLNAFLYEGMTQSGHSEPSFFKEDRPRTGNKQSDRTRYWTTGEFFYAIDCGGYGPVLIECDSYGAQWNAQAAQDALLQLWRYPERSTKFRQAEQQYDTEVRNMISGTILYRSLQADLRLIENLRNGKVGNGTILSRKPDLVGSKIVYIETPHTYPVSDYPDQWKDWVRQAPIMRDDWGKDVHIPRENWYFIDPDLLEWEQIEGTDIYGSYYKSWVLRPGQESKFYNPQDLEQLVDVDLLPGKTTLLAFIRELKAVSQALAKEPIKVDSGLRQPRKRIQHIVHAQQSHADKEKEIANQLLHLQKFTAWLKIAENMPQNPGKKCLNCGLRNSFKATYCPACGKKRPAPNEYIITTLPPSKGIHQLDHRIKRIQARNVQEGYIREKDKVEAEILQRQTDCSGAAPAQPQSTPQQPRHARQVLVQGKCPDCGFSRNPPGAKFCSNCGRTL